MEKRRYIGKSNQQGKENLYEFTEEEGAPIATVNKDSLGQVHDCKDHDKSLVDRGMIHVDVCSYLKQSAKKDFIATTFKYFCRTSPGVFLKA